MPPLVSGCSASDSDVEESEEALSVKPYATKISSVTGYKALSVEGGGFGQSGRTMKFVIDARTATPALYFVNGNYKVSGVVPDSQKYHYYFAKKRHVLLRDASATLHGHSLRDPGEGGGPARTAPILPTITLTSMVDIVRTVELAYCAAKPDYYDGDCRWVWLDNEKPKALDMEIKVSRTDASS